MTDIEHLEKITLMGEALDELPSNSVLYYADALCANYTKLCIIRKMLIAVKHNPNSIFLLERNSYPILPDKIWKTSNKVETKKFVERLNMCLTMEQATFDDNTFIPQTNRKPPLNDLNLKLNRIRQNKQDVEYVAANEVADYQDNISQEDFFRSLARHSRPVVYQLWENKIRLVYDYSSSTAIKLTGLTHNSPPLLDFLGESSILRDLVGIALDINKDRRDAEEHEWLRERHEWERAEHAKNMELLDVKITNYKEQGKQFKISNMKSFVIDSSDSQNIIKEYEDKTIQSQKDLNDKYQMRVTNDFHFDRKV